MLSIEELVQVQSRCQYNGCDGGDDFPKYLFYVSKLPLVLFLSITDVLLN